MVGKVITSALKAGIEELPSTAIKAESLPNVLKKVGVKEEELAYSGIKLPKTGKVDKQQLRELEAKRTDKFGTAEGMGDYKAYSLSEGADNPTYRENVYTFAETDQPLSKGVETTKAEQAIVEWEAATSELAKEVALDNARAAIQATGYSGAVEDVLSNPALLAEYKSSSTGARYTSEHFPDIPNYLMHTRTYTDTINGQPAHVVQEIQSDLHQAGRQQGYGTAASTPRQLDDIDKQTLTHYAEAGPDAEDFDQLQDNAYDILEDFGFNPNTGDAIESIDILINTGSLPRSDVPESPYKASWLKKGLEREVASAAEAGLPQIAIPISGNVRKLHRAPGVQKWYETQVLSTAKKLAKAHKMDFEVVQKGPKYQILTPTQREHAQDLATRGKVTQLMHFAENVDAEAARLLKASIAEIKEGKPIADVLNTQTSFAVLKLKQAGPARADIRAVLELPKKAQSKAFDEIGIDWPLRQQADDLAYTKTRTSSYSKEAEADALEEVSRQVLDTPSFSLYSSPAAGVLAAYTALQAGYSKDEVNAKLTEQGYEDDDIEELMAEVAKVDSAVQQGYSMDEVKKYLNDQEPKVGGQESAPISPVEPPKEGTPFGDAYRDLTGTEELSTKELLAKLEVLAPNSSFMTTHIAGFFGNEEARRNIEAVTSASQNRILAMAKEHGINLEVREGEFWAQTDKGVAKVTPEWWRELAEQKGEITAAVAGAYAGGKAGFAATPPLLPFVGPLAKPLGGLLGSIVGAAIGGSVGTEMDYLHSAIVLQEDMNAEVAARKALTAAETSVIGDVLFLGSIKVVGKSWNIVVKAKDWAQQGMFGRANVALKEHLFITNDESTELLTKLSRVANVPGKNVSEQQIAAAMTTVPGAEGVVKASTAIDAKASAAVAKAIDVRAQDLLQATAEVSDENIGRVLKGELEAYTSLVKENYGNVKALPGKSPRAGNFKFDYDAIAIDPVLARLEGNIDNPDIAFKFAKQSAKIRDMSSTRTLPDLLELRQLVNDFKFNKRIRSTKDFGMLNDTLKRIDHAIEQGAHHTLDNPKVWLKDFADARLSYAKMKTLEKNQVAKILNRPGVSEKVAGQALAKYAYALDDTFVDVLAIMPKATRGKVEGSVLETLAQKYTAGIEGGQRAVNFPSLAKDLEGVTFTSPDARALKQGIFALSDVFKNDVPLAQASGNIQVPKFQSFLTADPVVRAKFEIASSVFNGLKSLAPGAKARTLQLVRKTADVLENPVHSKSIKELVAELDGAIDIAPELEAMAVEAAKRKAITGSYGMPRVKLYGDGKVLSAKGKGTQQSIPVHRIASLAEAKVIAEATGINPSDKKAMAYVLKERGYMAVQLGADSIRRLD